jgi:hypothetical protein
MSGEYIPTTPTPEMIRAGVSVLENLEGEVSRVTLAQEVWLAMECRRQLDSCPSQHTETKASQREL